MDDEHCYNQKDTNINSCDKANVFSHTLLLEYKDYYYLLWNNFKGKFFLLIALSLPLIRHYLEKLTTPI